MIRSVIAFFWVMLLNWFLKPGHKALKEECHKGNSFIMTNIFISTSFFVPLYSPQYWNRTYPRHTQKKDIKEKSHMHCNKSRLGMFRVISCLKGVSKLFMLCTCGSSHHLLFKSFLLTMGTSGLNFSIF